MGSATTYYRETNITRSIDKFLRVPKVEKRNLVKTVDPFDLGRKKDLEDGPVNGKPIIPDALVAHVQEEFLAGPESPKAWWPSIPNKDKMLQAAYLAAINTSINDPIDVGGSKRARPIFTDWIYLPGGGEVFKPVVRVDPYGIHVLWITGGAKGTGPSPMLDAAPQDRDVVVTSPNAIHFGNSDEIDEEWAKFKPEDKDSRFSEYARENSPEVVDESVGIKAMRPPVY
ncbi:MAG: hypothetical protein AB8G23_05785 [Myxococcota bacterium]